MINTNKTFRVREISISYKMTDIELPENKASSAADIVEIFKHLQDVNREKFCVLHLTTRNKVIGFEVVALGGVTESMVSIPEIFKSALLHNAVSIVLVHNHPSGDPKPSGADKKVTGAIKEACQILQIRLLDHIIIGEESFFSFAEAGII